MASEIKLPELGENLSGGDVLEVRVKPGDTVAAGQPLLELEAEKSTVEVPSPVAGRVAKVLVKKGDTVQIGQTFCLIEGADGKKDEGPKEAPVREVPESKTEPEPPGADKRGVEPPEPTKQDVRKAEAAASKATERAPAPEKDGHDRQPPRTAPPNAERTEERTERGKLVPAGPATRRLARELGVDLHLVTGTAPHGRVSPDDVKAFVRQLAAGTVPVGRAAGPAPALPDFERWGPVERQPLDAVRRKTAEQMSLAWSQIPHVTQHDLADITDLDAFRKQQEGKGPKLTVTAFALKAAAIALKQQPQFNASLDPAANQLVVKKYYHLGVAVDTDRGLLVPVIRDVDKKSVQELAQELTAVAERARERKVSGEEMRGGTFTITNLGGIGGTAFTPIVNYPEVAILGLSRARLEPVVRDGQVVPRLMLPLSLSYDHRVIDGADAARFARRLAQMLENPWFMVLQA